MLKLNTPYTTPQGLSLTGTVWRWAGLSIDAQTMNAVVVLAGYPSAEIARAAGTPDAKQPFVERRFNVGGDVFGLLALSPAVGPTTSDAINALVYGFVKTLPEFAGAEDV